MKTSEAHPIGSDRSREAAICGVRARPPVRVFGARLVDHRVSHAGKVLPRLVHRVALPDTWI